MLEAPTPSPTPPAPTPPVPAPPPAPEPAPAPAPPAPPPPAAKAPAFPVMLVVGAVVGVLVLAGIGVGAFFVISSRSVGGTPQPPQPTAAPPPTTSGVVHTVASASPDANVQGWIDAPLVHVTLAASSDAGAPAVKSITYSAGGALTLASTTAQGASTSFDLVAPGQTTTPEGITTLTFAGQDAAGGQESPQTFVVKVNRTPPSITAAVSPQPTAGWNSTDVTVSFTCTDAIAQIASCDPPSRTFTQQGGNQTVTGVATNMAGKATAKAVTVNVDKTAPTTAFTTPAGANGQGLALPAQLAGTATVGPSGLGKVEVRIAEPDAFTNSGTGKSVPGFWDGSNWSPNEKWLPTDNKPSWTFKLAVPFQDNPGLYEFCARATNTAGVMQSTPSCVTFKVTTPPDKTPIPVCGPNGRFCQTTLPPNLRPNEVINPELANPSELQQVTRPGP
jgi:hypothetical protein